MPIDTSVVQKMLVLAEEWEDREDKRAIFLRCYSMMTHNMLIALEEKRFHDNQWVAQLLHRFADYYFDALACFDCGEEVPAVWRAVHESAEHKAVHVLQHLLLGVNAHINYDLVLTIHEMLAPVWNHMTEQEKQFRYQDHQMVNKIIGETIDKVQDEVVEQYDPKMDLVDRLMGRLDEYLLVKLISRWREKVWEEATALLNCDQEAQELVLKGQLEEKVMKTSRRLLLEL